MKYDFLNPYKRTQGLGNNVYLLGTSEDGPYMQPVHVRTMGEAEKIFGNKNVGSLLRGLEQSFLVAEESGKEISIYLMRITGKSATLNIGDYNSEEPSIFPDGFISFRTTFGGYRYNDIRVRCAYEDVSDSYRLIFILHNEDVISYDLSQYEDVGQLLKHINDDCRRDVHPILASSDYYDAPLSLVYDMLGEEEQFFTGGNSETDASKDELYMACEIAYNLLLGRNVDIVIPLDMYIDDVHPSFIYGSSSYGNAFYSSTGDYLSLLDTYHGNRVVTYHEQLIDFCRKQMSLGYMSHGVMGFRPHKTVPPALEYDNSYIARLVDATIFRNRYGLIEYRNGYQYDKGYHISLVASEVVFFEDTEYEYHDASAVVYGTLLVGQYETTTNMKLPGSIKLRYEFTEEVMALLAKLGVVTFRDSVRHGTVVCSGVTASHWSTELHNVANLRMVQLTIAYINDAVSMIYEGDLNPELRRTMLEELIQKRLAELKENGILIEYFYQIEYNRNGPEGFLHLSLQTKYTVNAIATSAEITNGSKVVS